MKTAALHLKQAALAAAAWALIPSAPLFALTKPLAISLSNPPNGIEVSNDSIWGIYKDENGVLRGDNAIVVDVRLDEGTKDITLTANFADTCPAAWRNEDGVEYDAFWQVAEPGQMLQPLKTMYKNSKPFSRSEFSDQSLRVDCDYDPNQPPPWSIRWSDVGNKDATATIDMAKCSPAKCLLVVLQIKWYKKDPDSVMGVEEKRRHYMPPPYPAAILLLRPYAVPEIECDPITIETEGDTICNPAGSPGESAAAFRVRKTTKSPASAAGPTWTLNDEASSFVSECNTGETVNVQFGPGAECGRFVTLACDFPDNKLKDGPAVLTCFLYTPKQIRVTAVVVDNAIQGEPAKVTQTINSYLATVNTIYKQAGMEFVLNGNVQHVTSQQVHDQVSPNTQMVDNEFSQNLDELHSSLLHNYLSGTGGVELYFVKSIQGFAGVRTVEGCSVGTAGMNAASISRVIAHEFGHASRLRDIYDSHAISYDVVTAAAVPQDWPGGAAKQGYYTRKLSMGQVRERLLMNGAVLTGYDIPRGEVFGSNDLDPSKCLMKNIHVGLTASDGYNIVRQPVQ